MDYRTRLYERYVSTHLGAGDRRSLQTDYRTWHRYFRLNYLRHLPADKHARILDVGCGMGQLLEFLLANGYKNCLGIDRSDEAVQYCLSRHLPVERGEASEHLSRHPETCDAIILSDMVEHLTKSEALDLVGLCHKALRPHGAIMIKTVNAANPIVGAHSLAIDLTHETIFCEESLTQLLNVAGFRDIQILPIMIYTNPYSPVHWIARGLSGSLNLLWRFLYRLYGRTETRCFAKSILAVARK